MMKPETIKVYEERYEEGYDMEGDELYEMWSKMKQLTISESPTSLEKEIVSSLPVPQQKISSSLDEVLTYPNPPLKTQKSKAAMPKHVSGEQVIAYLEEKKEAKQREEEEKEKRKQEREKKRLEREEEKKRKLLERERKKEQKKQAQQDKQSRVRKQAHDVRKQSQEQDQNQRRGQGRGQGSAQARDQGRGRGRGQGRGRSQELDQGMRSQEDHKKLSESSEPDEDPSDEHQSYSSSDSSEGYCCPMCGLPTRLLWVACDSCDRWFHVQCTDIDSEDYDNLDNVQ